MGPQCFKMEWNLYASIKTPTTAEPIVELHVRVIDVSSAQSDLLEKMYGRGLIAEVGF